MGFPSNGRTMIFLALFVCLTTRRTLIVTHLKQLISEFKASIEKDLELLCQTTEQKLQENQIDSLRRRNQALLDYSPVCHKIVDFDFNLQYMSDSGFKMLNIDDNIEVYGKPYPFYFFPEAFKKAMIENLKMVRETGEATTLEALTNDIEGNDVWLDSSLIPVFDEEGKIDLITVVSDDITRRKQEEKGKELIETQLQQSRKWNRLVNWPAVLPMISTTCWG